MALSKAREIALFKVLEVPYSTTTNTLLPDGLTVQVHDVTSSIRAAKTVILAHLTSNIYIDADIQTELESLLDDYIDLGTDMTMIDGGSIGNLSGIRWSPQEDREEIRRQVLALVPFWRHHDELLRSTSGVVRIIR